MHRAFHFAVCELANPVLWIILKDDHDVATGCAEVQEQSSAAKLAGTNHSFQFRPLAIFSGGKKPIYTRLKRLG